MQVAAAKKRVWNLFCYRNISCRDSEVEGGREVAAVRGADGAVSAGA